MAPFGRSVVRHHLRVNFNGCRRADPRLRWAHRSDRKGASTRSPSDSWARCAASAWTGCSRSPGDISKPCFGSTRTTTTATGLIERLAWKLRCLGGAFTPWAPVHPQSSAATYSADSSTSTRLRHDRVLGTHTSVSEGIRSARHAASRVLLRTSPPSEAPLLAASRHERTERVLVWFMRQADRSLAEYRAVRRGAGTAAGRSHPRRAAADVGESLARTATPRSMLYTAR